MNEDGQTPVDLNATGNTVQDVEHNEVVREANTQLVAEYTCVEKGEESSETRQMGATRISEPSQETREAMIQLSKELDAAEFRDWEDWEFQAAMNGQGGRGLLRLQVRGRVRRPTGG